MATVDTMAGKGISLLKWETFGVRPCLQFSHANILTIKEGIKGTHLVPLYVVVPELGGSENPKDPPGEPVGFET